MSPFVESILGLAEAEMKLKPFSTGLSKKVCHEKGMEMRRAGKTCFCMPNKDDPKKRDLMVPG